MTVLLEIKDSKAPFVMELLNNFSYVQTKPSLYEANEIVKLREKHINKDFFAEVRGIWADRDIDGVTLRNQAWGIEE